MPLEHIGETFDEVEETGSFHEPYDFLKFGFFIVALINDFPKQNVVGFDNCPIGDAANLQPDSFEVIAEVLVNLESLDVVVSQQLGLFCSELWKVSVQVLLDCPASFVVNVLVLEVPHSAPHRPSSFLLSLLRTYWLL